MPHPVQTDAPPREKTEGVRRWPRLVLGVCLLLLCLFFLLAWFGQDVAPGITGARYVSASEGNDNNDGTSPEHPWRSLARVSRETFGPGAVIYLKRGDTWHEALIPQGNGDFAADRWITVKPYGPENLPKPTIDRQDAKDALRDWAVKLIDNRAWRFEDLIIRNARTGIVYVGSHEADAKRGLQIVGCEFYNIRGLPNHAKKPEEDKRSYWWLRGSTAISITGYGFCKDGLPATPENCLHDTGYTMGSYGAGLSEVLVQDVRVENATYGIWIWGGGHTGTAQHYQILRPSITRAGVGGIELTFVQNAEVVSPRIWYAGGDGSWSGTFGMDINYAQNLTVQDGEIAYTQGKVFGAGDGEAINLNGANHGVRIMGMKLHHNDAMAIAIEGAAAPEMATYQLVNNRIWENALMNAHPAPGQYEYPAFLLVYGAGKLQSSAMVRNNWIAVKPKQHLICAVKDMQTPCWKDDLSMRGETRLPSGYLFCGNRDIGKSPANSLFIRGNGPCPEIPSSFEQ